MKKVLDNIFFRTHNDDFRIAAGPDNGDGGIDRREMDEHQDLSRLMIWGVWMVLLEGW